MHRQPAQVWSKNYVIVRQLNYSEEIVRWGLSLFCLAYENRLVLSTYRSHTIFPFHILAPKIMLSTDIFPCEDKRRLVMITGATFHHNHHHPPSRLSLTLRSSSSAFIKCWLPGPRPEKTPQSRTERSHAPPQPLTDFSFRWERNMFQFVGTLI